MTSCNEPVVSFYCTECDKEFPSLWQLQAHTKSYAAVTYATGYPQSCKGRK